MRLTKANIAGLIYPLQQAELKSILAGTWPQLKPLPVFKYETVEYRASIDFDKKRGEWVCRKTSLPSNKVQELRGGLAEITLALPHGEAEMSIDGMEQQEQELEKDTSRRLQAIRDWREKYENGARYFELRDFLSEGQRTEMDDSLRLSLTARQLQFNSKNVANVFDDLSIAGGRFAALIEFAKRNKAKQGRNLQAQRKEAGPEAERAIDHEEQSLGISSGEAGHVPNNNDLLVLEQESAGRCAGEDEFPAVTIKDVFPEQEQAPFAERIGHEASRQFEIEVSEIVDGDSPSLVEYPQPEEHHSPAFAGSAAQARTGQSFGALIDGSSSRFPALQKSAFQVNVFVILFLFAVTAFTVGLTVGRGPLPRHLREVPKSLLATHAKLPPLPDHSTSRTSSPLGAGSEDSGDPKKLDDTTPSEEKSKENTAGSENSAEVRTMDPNSSPTIESKLTAKPEVNSEHRGVMAPIVRSPSPRVNPEVAHSRKAVGPIRTAPRSHAPYRLTSTIGTAPRLPRLSTVLVTVPSGGSQPFRLSFPERTIAATSSLAMTSQLSVLVSLEHGSKGAHKPARLEPGELTSFVWPRYPMPSDRHRLAETIMVRATIGQLGQVLEVKFLGGSVSLLPATTRAIRQWHYRPTLLDKTPVQAQQDVTIEFRPPH